MKAKLIKKITGIYKLELDDKVIASDDVDMQKDLEIGKLSKQNCDEIFGVVDVEKLAKEKYPNDGYADTTLMQKGFIKGFNKAVSLNKDKVFTLEDMKKAHALGWDSCNTWNEGNPKITELSELIQSLQQPTEIEVEIEMKRIVDKTKVIGAVKGVKGSGDKITTYKSIPKLDSEGCLILKRAK